MKQTGFRFFTLLVILICLSSAGCKNSSLVFNRTMSRQANRGQGASTLMLATTTSTDNSGLLEYLLPVFEKECKCTVNVIAVGTGKALATARDGNVDAILVHDKISEEKFVNDGWGVGRREVMYNDFLIVGPASDPSGVKGMDTAADALAKIAFTASGFISRGDDSGTHKKEVRLWKASGIEPDGAWYKEVGQGMEKALRMADELEAYTLTDRGTYLSIRKTLDNLEPLVEGDPELFNLYGVIAVNPKQHHDKTIETDLANQFIDWLISPEAQKMIANFKVDGEVLFHPMHLNKNK